MFHPGKVVEVLVGGKQVLSSDSSVQAVIRMWDDNLVTLNVESKIAPKLKKEDVVLVDYTPMEKIPAPKMKVCKILYGKTASEVWDAYKKKQKENLERMEGTIPKKQQQYVQ